MTKVLVVDDEQRICKFVSRALQSEGFEVDTAPNGADALNSIATTDYSLVILDLLLPGMDGYEVLHRVIECYPRERVLILSAVGDVDSKVRCLRMGAVDYLSKPFAIAELIERVKHRVDEQSKPLPPRWLDVGEARLDLRRRALQLGSREIQLSQREFILVSHLMRHAGEVCTRGELLAEVWGYSFDPGSNVVDVCIRRVRSKVDHKLIETVRNVGYCFLAS